MSALLHHGRWVNPLDHADFPRVMLPSWILFAVNSALKHELQRAHKCVVSWHEEIPLKDADRIILGRKEAVSSFLPTLPNCSI